MQAVDVPMGLELIIVTSDELRIAMALQVVLGTEPAFLYCEPVFGEPRSGRLFCVVPHPKGEPITQELSANVIAHELMRLVDDARYAGHGEPGQRKGWVVYKFMIEERPAALVWAAWTTD